MKSENRVGEAETPFAPRFVETTVDFDFGAGPDTSLVCTNCGLILPVGTEQAELSDHLSRCIQNEIKGPYTWAIVRGVIEDGEDGSETGYHLLCNRNVILKAPSLDFFADIGTLNTHQVSPFDLVTEEYLYKYEFSEQLHSASEEVRRALDEALMVVRDLGAVISRCRPHIEDARYQGYVRYVRRLGEVLNEAITCVRD